ncbi:AAA family ATPase [Georgenia sp.]
MRIHHLTLQAIGPFPGRHTIDVDSLAAGGLFLLEGPTGSGKSTIIDAIVFALYGKVADAETSEDRLHSDHAEPDVEPFVDLTFSTAAGVYRVWRSPTFQRPKRRGGGFTQQNARAKLWRLSGPEDEAGEPVSAHVQEVSIELGRIVVLDRAQFTQTVVLPQGQFAAFLRAKPEARRVVLQDVFGTEIYEKVQRQLVEMAKAARAELEAAATEIGSATDAFVRAAGLREHEDARAEDARADAPVGAETRTESAGAPAEDAAGAGVEDAAGAGVEDAAGADIADAPGLEVAAALRTAARELDAAALEMGTARVHAGLVAAADRASVLEREAAEAVRGAQEHLDAHRTLAALITRRAGLLEEQRALEGRAAEIDGTERRLDHARRAATVATTVRAHAQARDALTAATASWERARAELAGGPDAGVLATTAHGGDIEALEELHERATAESGALDEIVERERGLPSRQTALEATERSIDSDAAALDQARTELAARPTARQELSSRLAVARSGAAEVGAARAAAQAAQTTVAAAATAERRTTEVARAEAAVAASTEQARAAVAAERDMRLRWIDGMAGTLAGELEPGRPCSVCGSTEHPAPAQRTDAHVSAADVERAERARQDSERHLREAADTFTRVRAQIDALREKAGGRDLTTARQEHEQAAARLAAAEDAAAAATDLEQELSAFDAATRESTAAQAQLTAGLAERRGHLAEVRRHLDADRARCAKAAGDAPSVAARAGALTQHARAVRALLDARRAQAAATETHDLATERLRTDLAAAGLGDAEEARGAALPATEMTDLERRLLDHRTAVGRVRAGLAEPAVAALTGEEVSDVAGAETAHAAVATALTDATRRASEARMRAAQAGSARTDLLAGLAAHAARAERAAPVLRTAALANAGQGNESATTLATYVLVRRFEDVVAAANDRLRTMSDGRYALERIDEKEGGQRSRRAGLGLQVLDQLTETPRDPRTLSGGETFYVSLCLALGLADVVRSEAGGIELGTLFVDEGFGSLDPDTLDAVMGELGRLREGGRAVGIVSHVAELKDRIAERIEVRRLPSGASTLTVRA